MSSNSLSVNRPVFAERSILELPESLEVQRRYPELTWIDDYQKFHLENMRQEKNCIIFARNRGAWLKPFYCYDDPRYRFFSLDIAEGCSFDCVYCYLQSYLNHGALVCFLDYERLQNEMSNYSGDGLWISTGLLTDSLLAESVFPATDRITKFLPSGAILELRSKSSNLKTLRNPGINRKSVVLSWSLNPERIATQYEYGAASFEERIGAACEAVALGYRVAFHLDPVFYYDTWNQDYADLFQQLGNFRYEDIAFLSLGLFRYMPELGAVIRKRFPFHAILTSEFLHDRDGKYHYFRPLRKEMYRSFTEWLAPWVDRSIPVFRAMEPDSRLFASQ